MVPFLDLSRFELAERDELRQAFERVLGSGVFLLGPELAALESEFAAFVGQSYCVAVSSGATALALSLTAAGVRPGDEVIVPAFTAVPSVAAVCSVGAIPVFVDVCRNTATMDLHAEVAAAVTARTRAVIPVHLYGYPSKIPAVDVPVIEDAAQAHGAVNKSRSMAVAYSFYPTKNLGGIGDGGAVVTDDEKFASEVRLLRSHGATRQDGHIRIAMNARMSEVEAAVIRIRLRRLASGNRRRRLIALHYRRAAPQLQWQAWHRDHVFHLCVVRVRDRERFRATVGFATAVHYPRALPEEPAYREFARSAYPEASAWARECVSVPCNPLLTDGEIDYIAESLARWE